MRTGWHRSAHRAEVRAWKKLTPPPMVLRPVNRGGEFSMIPDDTGVWTADALNTMRDALAYKENGETTPIHPRLLDIVYRAVKRFNAPYVHVISGYRPARAASRHGQGRAIDFVLPGVSDRALADFLRRQGFVGVGIYPLSGFVHVDVRAQSYFWVDPSGPGASQRTRPILRELAKQQDRRARLRNEYAVPDAVAMPEAEYQEGRDEGASAPGE